MTSTTQQITSIAVMEGAMALIEKYELDVEEALPVFSAAYIAVIEQAAEGNGICLRAKCMQQVSPMSSILCSDHLTEVSV